MESKLKSKLKGKSMNISSSTANNIIKEIWRNLCAWGTSLKINFSTKGNCSLHIWKSSAGIRIQVLVQHLHPFRWCFFREGLEYCSKTMHHQHHHSIDSKSVCANHHVDTCHPYMHCPSSCWGWSTLIMRLCCSAIGCCVNRTSVFCSRLCLIGHAEQ